MDIQAIITVVIAFGIGYIIVSMIMNRFKSAQPSGQQEWKQWESHTKVSDANDNNKWGDLHNEQHRKNQSDNLDTQHMIVRDEQYYASILSLTGKVTLQDIHKRYTELSLQYHPDRVNHLGKKIRDVAEKEMKELNEAFDYFQRQYGK